MNMLGNLVWQECLPRDLCNCHQPSPGWGPQANTTFYGDFYGDFYGGFEQSFYPAGGGNEGRGLMSVRLAPRGKQGTS